MSPYWPPVCAGCLRTRPEWNWPATALVSNSSKTRSNFTNRILLLVDLTSDITFGVLSKLRDIAANAKIVLWVQEISTELALQGVSLGVRGIVRRTLPVETLIRCLTAVNAGELWFEKALTESLMTARRYSLTRREGQLVALISQGLRNKEIAFRCSGHF